MATNSPFLCHDTEAAAASRLAGKAERARTVLADAGWLFDDFVNAEMRRVLTSDPDDMTTRELAYNRARVATELKAMLAAQVEDHEASVRQRDRRDQRKEPGHGR